MTSTPRYAQCDTKKPDGFYVQFSRVIEDDDATPVEDICSGEPDYRDEETARIAAFERGEWNFVGIRARAHCLVVRNGTGTYINLDSPGLWGIESDSGDACFEEVYREEIAELKGLIEAMRQTPQYEEGPA